MMGRASGRFDRWHRRQSFGMRALVIFVGIAILDMLTGVATGWGPGQWDRVVGALMGVFIVGALVLISRLRKRQSRVLLEK